MINTIDIIERLPLEHAARLEADEYFCDVAVVVADIGNVKREIQTKQASQTTKSKKRGVAVIVLPVVADDDFPNLSFGPMTLRPAFQVVENVELNNDANGTKKPARQVARRVHDVIKGGGLVGLVTSLKAGKPAIFPVPAHESLGSNIVLYQVNFECLEAGTQNQQLVAMPQFAGIAGPPQQFSITCTTLGAVIYYTLDDSYPRKDNPNAHVYTNPINIPPAGLTVRACAYARGSIASWVARETITLE